MIKKNIPLAQVAELVGGELVGDGEVTISNLASLEAAEQGDLTFLVKATELARLEGSKATASIVPLDVEQSLEMPTIRVEDPYLASAIIHNHILAEPFVAKGIHPKAFVDDECEVPEEVSIGPMVVLGKRVRLGERVTIEAGTVIGDDVAIGDDTILKANVTIAHGCILGNRVIIHSGTVIGSDGYGYATDAMGNHVKRPQVGIVRIDDDVEIGANTCIDRAAFGETWIQSGVKIDNLVQVGHNVVIGPNSLIISQVGLAGSCSLGRNVVLAGQVGVNGHIHLDDQVMVAAGGGVHHSLPKGAKVGGWPALPIKSWAKSIMVYNKLPELNSDVRKLKKAVAALQEDISKNEK
ncbi:UDP-3-O-(3-hydroxymyristoyl)glucosamine N-acyltransferase [Desulfosediminicola sp.]|uniref:UDP-3-O-(3-hydroxymyristoyl)glucosamine N-acyltransferase n=1 Tax=Desulfosediminicola sp. TaxID=2886825 RepID=UPI003AF2F295